MDSIRPITQTSRCRRCLRFCRLTGLFFIFFLVAIGIHLHLIGVPDYLKGAVNSSLRAHGISLEFESMRLVPSGIRGDRVTVVGNEELGLPKIHFQGVHLNLDLLSVFRSRVQVESIQLIAGKLEWDLSPTKGPTNQASFIVDRLNLDMNLGESDTWELRNASGEWKGLKVNLAGQITNATRIKSLLGRPKVSDPKAPAGAPFQETLLQWTTWRDRVVLSTNTLLSVALQGDAAVPSSLRGSVQLQTGVNDSPWGRVDLCNISISALPLSSITNPVSSVSLLLDAEFRGVQSRSNEFRGNHLVIRASLTNSLLQPALPTGYWKVSCDQFNWKGSSIAGLTLGGTHNRDTANAEVAGTNLQAKIPLVSNIDAEVASYQSSDQRFRANDSSITIALNHTEWSSATKLVASIQLKNVETPWAGVKRFALNQTVLPRPATHRFEFKKNIDWQTLKELLHAHAHISIEGVQIPFRDRQLLLDNLNARAEWAEERLNISPFEITTMGGEAKLSAVVAAESGACDWSWVSQIDPLQIWNAIDPQAVRWKDWVQWSRPPQLTIKGSSLISLKALTGSQPDASPLELFFQKSIAEAQLDLGKTSVKGIQIDSLVARALWSNQVWSVPEFKLDHPSGPVKIRLDRGDRADEFRAQIDSNFDPRVLKPLFNERTGRTLDAFEFGQPPRLIGAAQGTWTNLAHTYFKGSLELTNVSYQSNFFHHLKTDARYSQPNLVFDQVFVRHGEETVHVDGIGLNLQRQWMFFTNGVTTMDVMRVTRVIGPKTAEAVSPYRFHTPPKVRVWGSLPLKTDDFTDMHFAVEGGAFSYWRFNVPQISAQVDWVTNTLSVGAVKARFYQGQLEGDFFFDFRRVPKGELNFAARFQKSDLKTLLGDLTSPTNRADGILDGNLRIRSGLSSDLRSWKGEGELKLEQGHLWNVPLFSILSPVLNVVSPGLGNSRGSRAGANFEIKEGQAHTENLIMQEPTMRLRYKGWVDLDATMQARVEAELLRNGWFAGRALSWALSPISKLFEYKITGTLGRPRLEPLYLIPKVLLFPFNPVKGLKELFPEGTNKPASQSNPATK